MTPIPGRPSSFWLDTADRPSFPALDQAIGVDVAIVGGGIVGITTALLLKRGGLSVAVIEAEGVAGGVTGKTTAKITSLHTTIYKDLVSKFGEEGARLYGESQQTALERIAQFVAEYGIDCDFERRDSYTYNESGTGLEAIEQEAEAAIRLGLPASLVRAAPLPYPIKGAVRFINQAQFHPVKYLAALARQIPGGNCHVFENTRVIDVEEDDFCRVHTERGIVSAKAVVVATNLPILDRGLYFAKATPYAHTVLVGRLSDDSRLPGCMAITNEEPSFSVRTAPSPLGTVIVCTGGAYKPGTVDTRDQYRELERMVRERFPLASVEWRWTNEDFNSVDRVPFIGQHSPNAERTWVATGFNAWGMTNGTVAGMLLSDRILGRPNPWTDLYDARRGKPYVQPTFLAEQAKVAAHFVADKVKGAETTVEALAPGDGGIVTIDGEKVAAWRDDEGRLHAVSPVCTHLGCNVHWNGLDRTWDCPCHGSRYHCDGRVMHGPAVKALAPKAIAGSAGLDGAAPPAAPGLRERG
ncbi:MAG TPA: FAD-dependent oxidoreductase [Alphaproteobacteria bacterium]|nr:FAD-dependent oxidoreductase [Alphaproteobacteria bacterium]